MIMTVEKQRVCVIGAGPSGLSVLNAFVAAQEKGAVLPEIVCFEKQGDISGLWNYSWRTGVDEYGEPNHGSMYRYLWSNGPKECLELADYTFDEHFKKAIPSFPPRLVLRDYLLGRVKKYGIEKYVRLHHIVRHVVEQENGKFCVTFENLEERKCHHEIFDYVVVATGHFSVPHYPSYPGLDTFPGILIHAHDFKDAASYQDKRVVLIGSSYSAEDIALQLYKYGAKEVIISYRTDPMGFKWPDGIKEYSRLKSVQGSNVSFTDGKSYEADAIIFCTGYQHHFPFMADGLRLQATNIEYPDHLYKGCLFNENPHIIYLGMQDQWYTFTLFDAEAWFARDFILGKIKIPSKLEREADIKSWYKRCLAISTAYEAIDFQRDFIADLYTYTDYPKHDHEGMALMFKEWKKDKKENILTYRDKCFKSPNTGTMGTPLYAPWVDALDDSLEKFVE